MASKYSCRHRAISWVAGWVFTLAVASVTPGFAASLPAGDETAVLTPGTVDLDKGLSATALPQILSSNDVDRYRRIFEVQDDGNWADADKLIAKVESRTLMGHVLAQRYLHANYRSKYAELKEWMDDYADLPDAPAIYKMAVSRKPAKTASPKAPARVAAPDNDGDEADLGLGKLPADPRKHATPEQRRRSADLQARIRGQLKGGATLSAKKLMQDDETRKVLTPVEYDRVAALLAQNYFNDGEDGQALEWAGAAAKRSGRYVPEANWTAGLAAWRLKRPAVAAKYFEALATTKGASTWMTSAAAFWAARSHLVDRRPEQVNRWLAEAATYQRTFYGLLALRLLGQEPSFRWTIPALDVATFRQQPRATRGLALAQVGETQRAEREFRNLLVGADASVSRAILAVAARAGMAGLAMKINSTLYPNGGGFDGASYPVPEWKPNDGFRVDRALIFAMIRQESAFNPKAKSWAGAHGLMQLMPQTASFVARDRQLAGAKRKSLLEPEYNLALGQRYIEILRDDAQIDGGLFQIVAAWNGGPGNLNKWRRRIEHMNDPLFFIESIPSRETREFVERVITNLWIYRNRFEQPSPELDAIAAGIWPTYIAIDSDVQMAEGNELNAR